MRTYLDMDEILRHCRRYIGQEYDEPYLVSAVPEEVIRSLPAADVVEVVRCGECVYRISYGCKRIGGISTPPNWYCATGERKDGGQNNG